MSDENDVEIVSDLNESYHHRHHHHHYHSHSESRTIKRTLVARVKRYLARSSNVDDDSAFYSFYSMSVVRGVLALILCLILYGFACFLINNVHIYSVTYIESTSSGGGHSVHTCLFCGSTYSDSDTGACGHSEGEWVVIAEPTEASCGIRTLLCSHCSTILKSEYVDALADLPKVHIDGYVGNLSEEKDNYVGASFSDENPEKCLDSHTFVPDTLMDSTESVFLMRKFVKERAVMLDRFFRG